MKNRLTIIYYHEVVSTGEGFSYQKIEKDKFEKEMEYIQKKGYKTLFFSELEEPLPEKAIIVSFDDGFRSVYENAYPIMKKHGIKGNVYLPTKYIGNDSKFMSWEMISELHESDMFEFAGHTHNHVDIRTLTRKEFAEEIEKSNMLMKEKLGYIPKAFCMPFGVFDKKSINLLREFGIYKYILGSFYGMSKQTELQNRVLPRIGISNDDTELIFQRKLEGKLNWKGKLQRIRLLLQTMMGNRITEYEY